MNGLHVACTGRLGYDAEQRYTSTGKMMLQVNMAVDENTHATEGRPAPETTWLRVTVWEDMAEQLAPQLKKGVQVYVEGKLRLERWTANDGQPRSGLSVSAWTCQPLGQIGRRAPQREQQPVGAAMGGSAAVDVEDLPF